MTTILLNLTVVTGMLVVVPLGLRLIGRLPAWSAGAWLVGAVPGALSLWLPRGLPAAVLAGGFAAATVLLAGQAVPRLWLAIRSASAPYRLPPREVATFTALVAPVVGGSALVAERAGYELFGFSLPILSLTVAHFLYAGFAAALIAALVCTVAGHRRVADAAALCVPAGIVVVLAGFFIGDLVELVGAVVLTAGMWLVAWLIWREVRPAASDRLTRGLLAVAALVLLGTMVLALSWAVGRAFDLPHPSIPWLVATHGVANAFGFALCALLAWHRLRRPVPLPEGVS